VSLTPEELRLAIFALRQMIAQFSSKEDWHPEDWVQEQKEQRAIRRLLKKLESRKP